MPLKSEISLLLIGLVMCLFNFTSLPKHLRGVASLVISPVVSPINLSYIKIASQLSFFTKTQDLVEEKLNLEKQVKELEKRLLVINEQKEDIVIQSELSQFYGFDSQKLVPANVKGFYSLEQNNYLKLNRGSKVGVQVGDNVVKDRQLVGTVTNTTSFSSTVLLLNSKEVQVPAKVSGVETFGIFSCSNKSCLFNKVLIEQNLEVGDIVITSGGGDRYLPTLLLGSVVSVNSESAQVFKSSIVNYSIDPSKLGKVVIILQDE